jgi:hypothetical protein
MYPDSGFFSPDELFLFLRRFPFVFLFGLGADRFLVDPPQTMLPESGWAQEMVIRHVLSVFGSPPGATHGNKFCVLHTKMSLPM